MKIRFLQDTYIRRSPVVSSENIMGIARKGECLRVEKEIAEGQPFQSISRWYRDFLGRYYWAGAAEVWEEEKEKRVIPIKFDNLLPPAERNGNTDSHPEALGGSSGANIPDSPSGVEQIAEEESPGPKFDPQRMSMLIRDWDIIGRFWQQGMRGEGINVAILSTGIDFRHPDLAQNIRSGYNFCNLADSLNIEDQDGEGTAIAGLLAATGRHQVCGLAPEAGLFIGKVAESADGYTLPRLMDALYWLLEQPVGLAYLGAAFPPDALSPLEWAALDAALCRLGEKGILAIAPVIPGREGLFRLPAARSVCLAVSDQEFPEALLSASAHGLAVPAKALLTAGLGYRLHPSFSGPRAAAAAACGLIALLGQEARGKDGSLSFVELWGKVRQAFPDRNGAPGYLSVAELVLMNIEKG